MNLDAFFKRFDDLADSQERIPALRKVILTYLLHSAVNTPGAMLRAETLREAHKIQRQKLIKSARRTEMTVIPELVDDDLPPSLSNIPTALFDRLGNIASIVKGLSQIQSTPPGQYPLVVTAERRSSSESYDFEGAAAIIPLVSSTGHGDASIKRLHYQEGRYAVGNILAVVKPICDDLICARFIFEYLTAFKEELLVSRMVGTANVSLTVNKLKEVPVPLVSGPVLSRIDELMALCDRLEAQQQEREAQHAVLARAALARFADAPTPANLDFIFHKSYAIAPADLRKSILTLAVQGKLVPQDPNDELAEVPASPRITKFKAEKDVPFELPGNWTWVQLGQISELINGDRSKNYPNKNEYVSEGVAWINTGHIEPDGTLSTKWMHFITRKKFDSLRSGKVRLGDLVYCLRGATLGKTAIITQFEEGAVASSLVIIRLIPEVEPRFAYRFLTSPIGREQIFQFDNGSAQPNLSANNVKKYWVPIPPLAEQRRIVAKVDQLMALVDALETQLAASRATSANLLTALVAELTGNEGAFTEKHSAGSINHMKNKASDPKEDQPKMEPISITTKAFILRRFSMTSGYRSLGKFNCTYHSEEAGVDEASPICLVGLNGSGKSNLIEAVAEVFCFLELINLPWNKLTSASSRYRENRHLFELEYTLTDDEGERLIRVRKTKKKGAEFFLVKDDDTEEAVEPGRSQLLLLPRRIIGYSSGLNETVSHPFLRTKTIYSEEVRDAAPPEGGTPSQSGSVFDTRTLYMDYESNAAVIICNYLFRNPDELKVFNDYTRVCGVSSFGLRFNRKRAGKSGPNSIVRLTSELLSYQKSFVRCADVEWGDNKIAYDLKYELNAATIRRFKDEFKTAENLFMAMHKWSLLNALILSDEQRNVYLSADITKGALERPPSVPPSDRVFNIVDLKLNLRVPAKEIDYSGLSDGEHQFMQIIGTALLFSDPGTLFLLDEPESHFNPEWRTKFNLILNSLPNAKDQEYIVSTHSPFVVSGSRMGNVYKFERTGEEIKCAPVQFETYGASFDVLLKNLFSIDSLIDQSAREDLERIIKSGDVAQMQAAVGDFAESKEKRRLYEAIILKEECI